MDHLVGEHPVVVQLGNRSSGAHGNGDQAAIVRGISDATMDAWAAAHVHVEREMRDGKLAIVFADGSSSAVDPVQQVVA